MEKREFNFRVWHEKKEYMYENVAIGLMDKVLYSRGTPKKKGPDWYVSEDAEEDDILIMQFTGIRDDKKRRIFEGDVVKVGAQEKVAVVTWDKDSARFELDFIDEDRKIDFSDKRSLRQLKVAGNVYENPELIGGEPKNRPVDVEEDIDEEEIEEEE